MPNSWVPISGVELLQFGLAVVCGLVIGYEREVHGKPAGLTTILIVTLASTLVMQLGFRLAVEAGGMTAADPARLATAVVTGIGFLGAGIILRRQSGEALGVNTAATIWGMACVGLALGAGMYLAGVVVTALFRLALWLERFRISRAGLVKEETKVD